MTTNNTCLFRAATIPIFHDALPTALVNHFNAANSAQLIQGSFIKWRTDSVPDFRGCLVSPAADRLVRWDCKHPSLAFLRGFEPKIVSADYTSLLPCNANLVDYVQEGLNSCFVGTVRYHRGPDGLPTRWVPRDFTKLFEYEVYAPGGIDIGQHFGSNTPDSYRREVIFPGGIRREFIRSARQYGINDTVRIWHNPYFDPYESGEGCGPKLYGFTDPVCDNSTDIHWMDSFSDWNPTMPPVCEADQEPLRGKGSLLANKCMPSTCSIPRPPRAAFVNPVDSKMVYFFTGTRYVSIDGVPGDAKAIHGPKLINSEWAALRAAHFSEIDAVLPTGFDYEVYVFARGEYALIDVANGPRGSVLIGKPEKIATAWPSLKQARCKTVDAVLPYPGDVTKAYFFCGSSYVILNRQSGETVQAARDIWEDWPLLKMAKFRGIDMAFPNPLDAREAYFFSGSDYMRIKIIPETAEATVVKAPERVTDGWPSLKSVGFYEGDSPSA